MSLLQTRIAKTYALEELEEQDDSLPGVVMEYNMHVFGRVAVGVVAILKGLSWQGLLATSPQVRNRLKYTRRGHAHLARHGSASSSR